MAMFETTPCQEDRNVMNPDLNPIEHVQSHPVKPANELEAALLEEWQRLPQNAVRRLIISMHQRCVAVVNAQGGHTRY